MTVVSFLRGNVLTFEKGHLGSFCKRDIPQCDNTSMVPSGVWVHALLSGTLQVRGPGMSDKVQKVPVCTASEYCCH